MRMVEAAYPAEIAALLFAIPNGAHKSLPARMKFKAEGLRPGVPDLFFAYPHKGHNGLFIEMKRRRGGRVSDEQKAYIKALQESGYAVAVCHGCDEAFDKLRIYLGR